MARPAPSKLLVVPVSLLCPLYQTEAEELVHWSQVFSSFIKAWATAIVLPGLSNILKSQTNHCECSVMVGLCQSKHVLLTRGAVSPRPAPITSPMSVIVPVYLHSQLHLWAGSTHSTTACSSVAKCIRGAPTWGLKRKPTVDWHILLTKTYATTVCRVNLVNPDPMMTLTYCAVSEQPTYQTWRTHAMKSISVWPLRLPNMHKLHRTTLATYVGHAGCS